MKNVAKCDTWCELRNPVNHRVFERKSRPKPQAEGTPARRRHAPAAPPHLPPPRGPGAPGPGGGEGADIGLPWAPSTRGWPKIGPAATHATTSGGFRAPARRPRASRRPRGPPKRTARDPSIATPVSAGPPAEFKHINKVLSHEYGSRSLTLAIRN